jgi:hypothetical protein
MRLAMVWVAIDMMGAAASFLLFGNLVAAFVVTIVADASRRMAP